MRLTHEQMLAHWRRAHGYEDARLDCSIEHTQGIDIAMKMAMAMRGWYLNLLDTADLRFLTLSNEVNRLRPTVISGDGVRRIHLPVDVRRVVGVALGATDLGAPDPDAVSAGLRNPFDNRPAWMVSDSRVLIVTTGPDAPDITAITCVTDPGDEFYDLDESALQLINHCPAH